MKKFRIIYLLKGKEGDAIRIEPDVNILPSFEKFITELFPKFSLNKAGVQKTEEYNDLIGKKFLDDSGKCLFQISFNKEYIQFHNWNNIKKMEKILPKYCENPDEISQTISSMADKVLEQINVNNFLDKLIDFLNKHKINSVKISYFDLSQDDEVSKKCTISKLKKLCDELIGEYEDISVDVEKVKLFIRIETSEDKIILRFKEDLDISAIY